MSKMSKAQFRLTVQGLSMSRPYIEAELQCAKEIADQLEEHDPELARLQRAQVKASMAIMDHVRSKLEQS